MKKTSILGYTDYHFDCVVKFGGSLLLEHDKMYSAIQSLELCRQHGKKILVIPGGGPTDKTIESINKKFPLSPETHHAACARAQDQTGLFICDKVFSQFLRPCTTLSEARCISEEGFIPVVLPSKIIFAMDPFEKTWDITSDGIAVWFAWAVQAPITMILTNVDGIFPINSDFSNAIPIQNISAKDLLTLGHTSVDKCVPDFISKRGGKVWVGSGFYEDRLYKALIGEDVLGTFIF
ncbi:amino acid kinase family protein [Acinetobacter boissieri]|uniref:Aspartate/glutamate/uridylate kinase domain-containing protein n=1 Tax=Acinetobacter boissieri TaxID=1219383 RepID=A0A1G6H2E9_9GAMM|nr:hypothetical protein [Acinetobacter boissieri]SDB88480.1 hypothetical protein SAMN05421733_103206 [Acinetobacter boissieri]